MNNLFTIHTLQLYSNRISGSLTLNISPTYINTMNMQISRNAGYKSAFRSYKKPLVLKFESMQCLANSNVM